MITFKIYPTKNNPFIEYTRSKYAKICVFDNREDMYNWFEKKFPYDPGLRDYAAIVKPTPQFMKLIGEDWVDVDNKCVATALFIPTTSCNNVDFTIMIHESVHIALATLRHLKKFPKLDIENTNDEEEKLAYMVQEINYQFLKKMVKKGLW